MLTCEPTKEMFAAWQETYSKYKDRLRPNRKSGAELLSYLRARYELSEFYDADALDAVAGNVSMNDFLAEKLPAGTVPQPRVFYLENSGAGQKFYQTENVDGPELWGGDIERIFVGVELASGFYMVEGSTLLWDELCAFQGLDAKDLQIMCWSDNMSTACGVLANWAK